MLNLLPCVSLTPPPSAAANESAISATATAPPKTSKRGKYIDWSNGEHKAFKAIIMQSLATGGGDINAAIKAAQAVYPTIVIKRQSVNNWLKKMKKDAAKQANKDDTAKALAQFDRDADGKELTDQNNQVSLTSAADREFLQSVIISRDQRNAGMTRKELIAIIAELGGVKSKRAENHLDYLIRSKKLPNVKNNGRVVRAQATTTNRTAITTEKLLRTHMSQAEGKYTVLLSYYIQCVHQ